MENPAELKEPWILCLEFPSSQIGLPRWQGGTQSTCQCRRIRRHGFDPWVRKTPWRRKWQPTPVFLPGKLHGQRSPGRLQSMGLQRLRHNWATAYPHRNFPTRMSTWWLWPVIHRGQFALVWGGCILFSFQEIPISSLSCPACFAFLVYCQHWLLFPEESGRREETIRPINLPKILPLKSILSERCLCHWEGPWVRMIGQRRSGN